MSSWIPYRRILTARNQVRYSAYFGTAEIETITIAGTVVPSECLVVRRDSFNSFTVMSELLAYGGHSGIHLHVMNWISAEGKRTCKQLVLWFKLKAMPVKYLYKSAFSYEWLTERLMN
jgi:hypothetical protein